MRFFSLLLAAGLAGVSLTTSLSGQATPDAAVDPRSLQLLAEGRQQRAAGQLDAATDTLETAVAVDPRNRGAFLTLAQIASQRGLPGKAIRLYREVLVLKRDDLSALRGQGEAMVQKGALVRAQDNLKTIRTLCKGDCPDATALAAAIAKGPPVTTAQNAATPVTPKTATP